MTSVPVDPWIANRLPEPASWPEFCYDLPELQYPEVLNAADDLLDRHLRIGNGERLCLRSLTQRWTYAHTVDVVNQIAHVLVDEAGIIPGNRILLRGANSPMLAACWLAVLKVGAIAVTTMALFREHELGTIMEKADVQLAISDWSLRDDLLAAIAKRHRSAALFWNRPESNDSLEARMACNSKVFSNVATAANDIAIIAFTSGTTGQPKAAVHSHRDLLATCDTFGVHVLKARADDVFCGSPPLGFTFGLGGLLLFPLQVGASTLLLESASPDDLLAAIASQRVTTLFTAPLAYRAMAVQAHRFDLSSLRSCVSAGETLPKAVWDAWFDATGVKIIDGIGSTEMLHIFIASDEETMIPGSTGRVVPGYRAEIHDERGHALPVETPGRLAVKGPTGCRYLDDERQSVYVQRGWNYPGDTYRMDSGGYFWYLARSDDMIISAGYNISGPEVEQILSLHPCIKDCAVVAKPDSERGTNIVKAYVVLTDDPSAAELDAPSLITFCKEHMASFKAPREVEFLANLPRTSTGKLQRFRLRELAREESS